VKTDVEELSPTRVRLTVGVPFDELKPSLDQAYRQIARQVRIPGFRPGHVPRQILDQRVGRDTMLEHAIQDAVPGLYAKAVQEAHVAVLGQPDVEITRLDDGTEIEFTAEVDVRPSFEVPDAAGLQVVVDDADVSPDEVEEYLRSLRERFATLRPVERPAEAGDYVSIDLSAEVDGTPVADAQATGISYEVGSGAILDGLDDTLIGMAPQESRTFRSELAGGEHAGSQADVTVTVRSVKVKELPELDDEFAQSASEFNTVGELRASTRRQLEAMRRAAQAGQARDRVVEALLERVDMPLPEALVEHEITHRRESLEEDLQRAGLTREAYLQGRGIGEAELEKEIADEVRRTIKARFILDKIAEQEGLRADQEELGRYVTQLALSNGVSPEQFARQITDSGQIGAVVADVLRSKAADLVARRASVTDQSGRRVTIGSGDEPEGGEPEGEEREGERAEAGEPGAASGSPPEPEPATRGRSGRRGAKRS